MTTVALIGADGAGKTTVGRRIEDERRLPVKYLYLGVNAEASNHLFFTTRLSRWLKRRRQHVDGAGPPPPVEALVAPAAQPQRGGSVRSAKATVKVLNRMADEWYRQVVAWNYERRGEIVVFDRHYLADFSAHDMDSTVRLPFERRLHGWMLRHLYPAPDLVIFLDAPPQVLLDRKGEGSLADLERRREDYLSVGSATEHFVIVDASRPLDEVVDVVHEHLRVLSAANGPSGRERGTP